MGAIEKRWTIVCHRRKIPIQALNFKLKKVDLYISRLYAKCSLPITFRFASSVIPSRFSHNQSTWNFTSIKEIYTLLEFKWICRCVSNITSILCCEGWKISNSSHCEFDQNFKNGWMYCLFHYCHRNLKTVESL